MFGALDERFSEINLLRYWCTVALHFQDRILEKCISDSRKYELIFFFIGNNVMSVSFNCRQSDLSLLKVGERGNSMHFVPGNTQRSKDTW